jgi:hypothetical protein
MNLLNFSRHLHYHIRALLNNHIRALPFQESQTAFSRKSAKLAHCSTKIMGQDESKMSDATEKTVEAPSAPSPGNAEKSSPVPSTINHNAAEKPSGEKAAITNADVNGGIHADTNVNANSTPFRKSNKKILKRFEALNPGFTPEHGKKYLVYFGDSDISYWKMHMPDEVEG